MADLNKQAKRLALEKAKGVSEKEIFLSPKFKTYIQSLIDSVLQRKKIKPQVNINYDEKENTVAYTTGNMIYLNAGNRISNTYSLQSSRMVALLGIAFHECAHILYLDFDNENIINQNLENKGELYGDLSAESEVEDQYIDEINEALNIKEFRPVFTNLYHHISNIFSDVHDESKICHEFHGLIEKGITFSAEAMHSLAVSIENMTKAYDEKKTTALELMLSLILEFARYGNVVIEDDIATQDNEFLQKLKDLSPLIMKGCTTDDLEEKYTAINSCIIALWPYIKEILNESSDANQENDDSSNGSGNNSDSSGSNSNSGSSSGNSQNSGNGSTDKNADNTGNTGNDNQSGADNSQIKAPSEQQVKDVLDNIQQAVSKSVPNSAPAPTGQKSDKQKNSGQSNNALQSAMTDEQANAIAQNLLNQVKQEIGQEKAEDELEKMIDNNVNAIVKTVNMTSPHKNKPINMHRNLKVSKSDIETYNFLMRDLAPVSKALQKQMINALRDLKEGDVLRHRSFGSKLDAKDAYRIDNKFFSKKKLPQDLPDMAISVLVDLSGSMSGERITSARKATMLLYDFAKGLDIPVMISGHCAKAGDFHFYRYAEFDSVNDKDKYRLSHIESYMAGNRDGMALNITSDLLSQRPEQVKLMIIISDGQPADWDYGGEKAKEDIQEIVKKYKHTGVQTFAAAIGSDKVQIQNIYKDGYLDISDLSTLPKALVKLVKKRII